METSQSRYRQIFKSASLFGGVQIIRIFFSIIQSKIIAVLLGPAGIGLAGLFSTSTGLISNLTNFGLGISAVRNISKANEDGNRFQIAKIITVLKRLIILTGLLGFILTFIFAPLLSDLSFGTNKYTLAFRWISVTLFINQLTAGQNVLLQGMRRLNSLAKANVIGSFLSLAFSIPLYFYYNIDGIVPAMILSSIIASFVDWFFCRKIKIVQVKVSVSETIKEGKSMIFLGFMLSLGGLMATAGSYIIRAYISNFGGMEDVGFYSAGFAIIGSYVGLVFTAMSTDYYPRLSAIAENNQKAKEVINQQIEVAILLIGPILCVFFVFANWAVILLYSKQFMPINVMLQWAALGMYFKTASWAIAFIFLAKGEGKLYLLSEFVSSSFLLILNIVGYKYYGLNGLGISFLVSYLLYFIQVYFITKIKYEFSLTASFMKLFILQFTFGFGSFLIVLLLKNNYSIFLGTIIIAISGLHSFIELDKRLNLKEVFLKKIGKK